ncbi:hypothetical protein [Spiroplasma endosymbiont of Seladonia tumulorum]|uniref:hypothetical protein n=1 Tax=Spiroplasma endosymbiont of Seladonia tumulorum TaxID=3066321 RepID=UPI0030D1641C
MEYKDAFEQANDIIQFYLSSLKNSTIFIECGLTINVDYGAGGRAFIDVLNSEKKYRYGKLLRFEEVDKSVWLVADHVNAFIGAIEYIRDIVQSSNNKLIREYI